MRNLKKFLALVMAMVMAFSLMLTVNAADQVKDWTDKDQVTEEFTKAVDVLSGMEIFQGDDTGTLRPGDTISRAEVAALIYRAATGDTGDTRAEMYRTYAPFTDVKPDDWFAGYVGYCWNAGYIKGTTATTFNPYEKVTGYEVLAMILRAVGYDKNHEFEGGQWIVNVASIANDKKVTKDVKTTIYGDTLHTAARRDVVASLLFNAIQIDTVTYTPALGYETDRLNGSNKSLGEIWFNLKHVDGGVIVGNQDTGESKTIVNKAKDKMPDHYSYFYNTKNWDEDLTAANGDAAKVETADSYKIDAKTGIDMFGHKVEVYFNEVSGKTFALYDNVKKTALVTTDNSANTATLSADDPADAKLGQAALDAGFKVDKKTAKAVFNQSFGISGAEENATTANSTTDYNIDGDAAMAPGKAAIKTNAISQSALGSDGEPYTLGNKGYPLYLLISNNDDLTVDMVVAINVNVSRVTQVNDYTKYPAVTVAQHTVDAAGAGNKSDEWNDKANGMIEQKALTATSNKALGDKVVGLAIKGTTAFTPTANAVGGTAPFGAAAKTGNFWYRLSTPTSTVEGTVTGYNRDTTTHTGSVTVDGKVIQRSLLADAITGYDATADSKGTNKNRGITANSNGANLSPDTGDYGKYRLYLDAEGKYIWAEPLVNSEFIYGTYVDYQTAYGSSSYEYTLIGVNLAGEQVKKVVTSVGNKKIGAAEYGTVDALPNDATRTNADKLLVPYRDTDTNGTGGVAGVTPNRYVGFNVSESGALIHAYGGTDATPTEESLPGTPTVYRAEAKLLPDAKNATSIGRDAAKLGMMEVNSSGMFFTNSTKFIVVDGAGTDTQKVQVYTGMTELLDGASQVSIRHLVADGTLATAGHGHASRYLDTTENLNKQIFYTTSPFTYASTTGTNKQVDTIIIPKAALVYTGRTNLVYNGSQDFEAVSWVGGNTAGTNDFYMFTMYANGEAGQYWFNATDEAIIDDAHDKFYEIEDSGEKMPDGSTIWTVVGGAAITDAPNADTGRPDVNAATPAQPVITRQNYWAATYSAQTASVGSNPKGVVGGAVRGDYNVSNAKVVNLNAPNSPKGTLNSGYIWSTVTDLGSLNAAASAADSYRTALPKVSIQVDPTDPMTVTYIYVCFDQTT